MITKDAILQELKRRSQTEEAAFNFKNYSFPKQFDFFRKPGPRFRTAVCSRRAGKTVGIAGDMIDTCLKVARSTCLYITITRDNVRRIIWGDIQKIIENFNIQCSCDNLRLEVRFPNGSRIITGGAKDATEIEKFRGLKLTKVYIDECQSMRPHIKVLIADILVPALRDLRGSLYLTGTPGPVKAGAFYEYSHNQEWFNSKWTAYDNPYMHKPPELDLDITLEEERKLRGISIEDASYRRETFGEWVEDTESLVIRYSAALNHYEELPPCGMDYILGIDIGYEDSDAIAVIGYSYGTNEVYLVEELERSKQDITELANSIKQFKAKYEPIKMVMDAGALGKKIQEELRLRHQLNIEAADKQRKFEYLEFMNADLRKGILKAKQDSLFAQDAKLVTWDRSNPEKPKISNVYHSDIMDAVLYAYRESRHFIKNDVKSPFVSRHSEEYLNQLEQKEADKLQRMKDDPEMAIMEEIMEQDDNFWDEDEFI